MRIAEINDIASVATEIAAGLRALGHEVDFFAPRLFGARLPTPIKPVTVPARALDWLDIVRHVRAGNYDLAHIHYAYLGNLGRLGHFPYLLHCHGTDLRGESAFTRPLVRSALRHASHVFYATPDLRPYLHDLRPDAEFLPNPIDLERFAPSSAPATASGVFICCGLTEIKGAETYPRRLQPTRGTAPRHPVHRLCGRLLRVQLRSPPERHRYRPPAPLEAACAHQSACRRGGQMRLGTAGMAELEALACGRPVVTWFNDPDAYPEVPPCHVRSTVKTSLARSRTLSITRRCVNCLVRRPRLGIANHGLDQVIDRVETVAQAIVAGEPIPSVAAA